VRVHQRLRGLLLRGHARERDGANGRWRMGRRMHRHEARARDARCRRDSADRRLADRADGAQVATATAGAS
jgi:hypothetical protein